MENNVHVYFKNEHECLLTLIPIPTLLLISNLIMAFIDTQDSIEKNPTY